MNPIQVRSQTALHPGYGALEQSRTADLILTKDALCLLSYKGINAKHFVAVGFPSVKRDLLIEQGYRILYQFPIKIALIECR